MKKKFLEIGKIVTTHGVMGEVKVYPWCDSPYDLCEFERLYLNKGKTSVGVDTMEQAQKMRDQILFADRDDMDLEEGEYFIQDLIGLEVVDADTGESYGKLSDVSQTGANDVYHISKPGEKEKYIPAIKQVVIETDVDGGVMKIRPLKGLFDDED